MISEHDKRRASLAEHYAREAIVLEATGSFEAAAEAIDLANEYLSTLFGRAVSAATPGEIIAYICQFCDAPGIEA